MTETATEFGIDYLARGLAADPADAYGLRRERRDARQ